MAQESGSQSEKAQQIKSKLDEDVLSSAQEYGINVDEIVEQKIEKHTGYAASTVVNFVRSDINRKIEAEQAEVLKGIHMGSRQRFDGNGPRRHALVRSSGDHAEVTTWEGSLPSPSGEEVAVPEGGAKVTIRADYQEKWDSYNANRLDGVTQVDTGELAENLSKVAISPDDLVPNDEYSMVVVEGTIRYVSPQTVFAGDDREDWYDGPVMMEDARGELQPHMEISLGKEGQTSLRGHLSRQQYGKPFIRVEDFHKLVADAYENEMFETPDAQTEFVGNGITGRDVIMVGNVSGYEKTRTQDGDPVVYVDLGLTAIVEKGIEGDEASGLAGADVGEREPPEEPEEPDGEPEEPDGEPEDPDEEPGEPDADASDDDGTGGAEVGEIRQQIENYAQLVGEDVADLSVGDIQDKAGGIEAPESVIAAALDGVGDQGGSDSGSEGDDAEDPLSRFDALVENGMYQCPEDGCPGKASSISGLISDHVMEAHDVESPDDAEAFLDERL